MTDYETPLRRWTLARHVANAFLLVAFFLTAYVAVRMRRERDEAPQ